ncbi:Protein transport protein SEC22 [Termitomyces sp. J132]|nr:Protein transport protein SEC22 [Termitomyces sp. J132]
MVRSTIIVRASDALPLAASVDDEQTEQSLQEHKQQAKLIFRRITPNAEPRCSIESGQYTLHYLISENVVFLTIADKSYPRKLAFSYLDELSKEFATTYGPKVESVRKPYAFVGFDTFMSKTARLYRDTRTATATSSLDKLNDDLHDVTRIMTKNMEELLWRGDSLDPRTSRNLTMQRAASPYRPTSPYYQPLANQHRDYRQTPTGQVPTDGSLAYMTSAGKEGQVLYHIFKYVFNRADHPSDSCRPYFRAVPASYTISNNVVNGMQWVPVEVTQTLPTGVQPASRELVAIFNRKPGDDWRRQNEAGAKRMQDLDKDLLNARELDAQNRELRKSISSSVPPSSFSTSGSVGSGTQYHRSPYSVYSAYSDLDRQMGNLDLRDRGKEAYTGEKEVKTHAPRPQAYTANEVSDRSRSPHPGVRPVSRSEGPYGQPILPQDRARMTPIPRGPSPVPPGPYNSSAAGLSQSRSSPNMSVGAPLAAGRGAPPQQLAAPEGFSRPVNGSHPFTPFDIMKIQDMEKFWSEVPRIPGVLMTHDVFEEDWRRLMHDMALAWAGKLPIPEPEHGGVMPRRSTIVVDLVNLWNESFFLVRGVELVLFRGKERRTGRHAGLIEGTLPYLEEPDDYISSEEESIDDDSDSDLEYGGGRYQHPGYGDPQQQMAEIFEEGRRRKEAKIAREAERRRRRQERHRKRREKIRARKYALYMTYVPTNVAAGGYGGGSGYSSGSRYGGRY